MKLGKYVFLVALTSLSIVNGAHGATVHCQALEGDTAYIVAINGQKATISSYNRLTAMAPLVAGTYSGVSSEKDGEELVFRSEDGTFTLDGESLTATLNAGAFKNKKLAGLTCQ